MLTRVFYTTEAKNWHDLLKTNKKALKAALETTAPNDDERKLLESLLPLYDLGILPTASQSAYKTEVEYIVGRGENGGEEIGGADDGGTNDGGEDDGEEGGYWFQKEQLSYIDFLILDDGLTPREFLASVLADQSLTARITDYSTGSAVLRDGSYLDSMDITLQRRSDQETRLLETEWEPVEGWKSDPVPLEETCVRDLQAISGNIIWCQVTTEEDVSAPDRIQEHANRHMRRQSM